MKRGRPKKIATGKMTMPFLIIFRPEALREGCYRPKEYYFVSARNHAEACMTAYRTLRAGPSRIEVHDPRKFSQLPPDADRELLALPAANFSNALEKKVKVSTPVDKTKP